MGLICCCNAIFQEFQAELASKSDNFKDMEAECGSLILEFQEKIDGKAFNIKSLALVKRLNSIQAAVSVIKY